MDMSKYIVGSNGTLIDAAQAIAANRSRCVVVINGGKAVGILSEGDLLRILLRGTDIHSSLLPFINHGFTFLQSRNMSQALGLFRSRGISLIPILNEDLELEDVITIQQMLDEVELIQNGSNK